MSYREVVVGVDGSYAAERALLWAAAEAQRRRARLLIAHAGDAAEQSDPNSASPTPYGQALLIDASASVFDAGIDCEVRTVLRDEPAVRLLTELGAKADLVVVGSHGLAAVPGALLGSVAYRVVAHSGAPVAVVGEHNSDRAAALELPITVGLTTSRAGQTALEFAFAEAALRGVGLRAVHSWAEVDWSNAASALLYSTGEEFFARQEQLVREVLAPLRAKYPQVAVSVSRTAESVERSLVQASARSSLLVLGSRHGSRRLLSRLGPTGSRLVHVARCPVVLVGKQLAPERSSRAPLSRTNAG
ncbi:MAG: universal stress protein [Jatrophihabitantaceae bacterium]